MPAQFETMVLRHNEKPEDVIRDLNRLGEKGWKLVAVSSSSVFYWLVREKTETVSS